MFFLNLNQLVPAIGPDDTWLPFNCAPLNYASSIMNNAIQVAKPTAQDCWLACAVLNAQAGCDVFGALDKTNCYLGSSNSASLGNGTVTALVNSTCYIRIPSGN